jgi:hypothetical protein
LVASLTRTPCEGRAVGHVVAAKLGAGRAKGCPSVVGLLIMDVARLPLDHSARRRGACPGGIMPVKGKSLAGGSMRDPVPRPCAAMDCQFGVYKKLEKNLERRPDPSWSIQSLRAQILDPVDHALLVPRPGLGRRRVRTRQLRARGWRRQARRLAGATSSGEPAREPEERPDAPRLGDPLSKPSFPG